MQIVSLINQKGGVGKTTTVANLAAALAAKGLRIGMIDLDPQSHLTIHFGLEPGAAHSSVYEMLTEDAKLSDIAVSVQPNLWLAPACIDLAGAEIELVATVGREQLLADRLAAETLPYDYIFIDCPPSLSLLTLNALAATDEVLIPLQPHFLALQGLGKLLETVALVQRRVNPRLKIGGVVLCMYESNTRLAGEVTEDVISFLNTQDDPNTPWAGARLYKSRIRRNVKLAECPSFGESIFRYAPTCPGAADYEALAAEFLVAHGHGSEQSADAQAHEAPAPAVSELATDEPVETPAEDQPVVGEPAEDESAIDFGPTIEPVESVEATVTMPAEQDGASDPPQPTQGYPA